LVEERILTLVRHGQSTYNAENKMAGSTDVPLTVTGKFQARETGILLSDIPYHKAFSSDLNRAKATLKLILKENDFETPFTLSIRLIREQNYGFLEGKEKNELISIYGEKQVFEWRRSIKSAPPSGETFEEVRVRAKQFMLLYLQPALTKGNVLVVSHGNFLRALSLEIEKIDVKIFPKIEYQNGQARNIFFNKKGLISAGFVN
jgi:2,3-bisphosphoglycerate-dependent phosphoglycerate mutase